MHVELPDTLSPDILEKARPAIDALRVLLDAGSPPAGLTAESLTALLILASGVSLAVAEEDTDLNPSEAALRLGMARPSVMRLIAHGDLPSRKESGHYVLSPRDLRSFQGRLATARREALANLAAMAGEYDF